MRSVRRFLAAAIVMLTLPVVQGQTSEKETLPAGTILAVQLDSDASMKAGTPVYGHITEAAYAHDKLVIPSGTHITGKIVELQPAAHHRSLNAKLQGDFTPLHEAAVQFQQITFQNGVHLSISTATTTQGVETLHIQDAYAAAHHQSLLKRLWNDLNGRKNEAVATITAPGKTSRLKKMFYHQLPYHPEELDSGLEYNAELTQSLELDALGTMAGPQVKEKKGLSGTASLHALLTTPIDSLNSSRGTPVSATVTEPFFDKEHQLMVPQGSVLVGSVSESKAAGRWARDGILRFTFSQLQFPAGFQQRVYGTATAVSVDHRSNLQMNVEGGVAPQKPSALLPLAMGVLSFAALHEDEVQPRSCRYFK